MVPDLKELPMRVTVRLAAFFPPPPDQVSQRVGPRNVNQAAGTADARSASASHS